MRRERDGPGRQAPTGCESDRMTNKLQELYEAHVLMHVNSAISPPCWANTTGTTTRPVAPSGLSTRAHLFRAGVGHGGCRVGQLALARANPDAHYPAEQLQAAQRLRELGQQWGVEELSPPPSCRGSSCPRISCRWPWGVLGLPAYYRGAMDMMVPSRFF